jgi:hypothetical protein
MAAPTKKVRTRELKELVKDNSQNMDELMRSRLMRSMSKVTEGYLNARNVEPGVNITLSFSAGENRELLSGVS